MPHRTPPWVKGEAKGESEDGELRAGRSWLPATPGCLPIGVTFLNAKGLRSTARRARIIGHGAYHVGR